jgi:hypothetical protein
MMRKPAVPRFIALFLLFTGIFIVLIQIQFGKKTDFTHRVGNLVIQGHYVQVPNGKKSNTFALSGGLSVFFGGVEFLLREGFTLFTEEGETATHPLLMTVSNDGASFQLAEGPELFFTTQYTGGTIELVIRCAFADDGEERPPEQETSLPALRIPYRALPTSRAQIRNELPLINADGANYAFSRSTGTNTIILTAQEPVLSYRAVPDRETANPEAFIIAAARNQEEYDAAVTLWLDQSYSAWNRAVLRNSGDSEADNSALLIAYMTEALRRGTYRAAGVSVLQNPQNTSWQACAYVGKLENALRLLAASDRERSARLARVFNEKSLDFLKESHVVDYLAIRGYNNLMNDAAGILRAVDPAEMTLEQAAGFLEGFTDWDSHHFGSYNPYDRFVDQALFVITKSLLKDSRTGYALAFGKIISGGTSDTELNLRLGRALTQFDDETRSALGKSLILSVLSLADSSGAIPRRVSFDMGVFTHGAELMPSFHIYRVCFTGENYARMQAVVSGIWAWTAASSINSTTEDGRLDIIVNFPAGETHYLIIRGVRPFSFVQLNGTTVNQDTQFERYDYSGWSYSASEQTLLIKLRQRLPAERISIVY